MNDFLWFVIIAIIIIVVAIGVYTYRTLAQQQARQANQRTQLAPEDPTVNAAMTDLSLKLGNETQSAGVFQQSALWLLDNAKLKTIVAYQYNAGKHELTQPITVGQPVLTLPSTIRIGESIYGDVARDRQPLHVQGAERDPRFGARSATITEAYFVPILYQQTFYGVISAQSDKPISNASLTMIEQASNVVGSMVALTKRLSEFQEATARFDRFQQLAQGLTTRLELGPLLQEIVEAARTMLETDIGVLMNLDEEKDELRAVAWSGIDEQTAKLLRVKTKEDLKGLVAWAKLPARSSDLRTDQRTALASFANVAGMISEMAVPILYGDHLLGILAVETKSSRQFTMDEMNLLSSLASHAGVSIRNAQLFEDQRTTNRKLESAVADATISQQQAENARISAVEANKLKTEFINNMSHELRTPLNAVINFTRIVMDGHAGTVNDQQTQFLSHVHDSGQHLLGLINDILDLAKIEAGKMDLRKEPTELEPILRGVMSTAIGLTRDRGLWLKLELGADIPSIDMDGRRIRQVLLNLLSNAAKFTQEGGIILGAEVRRKNVVISVKDTGIGIRPEDLPKVFEEFRQIDGSLTREVTGTGLGMPISKRFVQLHGGDMWIQSEFGVGTTVFFSLPISTEPVATISQTQTIQA